MLLMNRFGRWLFGGLILGGAAALSILWLRSTDDDRPAALASPATDGLHGGFSSPLLDPTAPVPLRRLVLPWEPHRMLVLGLTPEVIDHQPEVYGALLELIRIASEFVEVAVMYPDHAPDTETRTVLRVMKMPEGPAVSRRLHFIPSSISSIWVRDSLPQYAVSRKQRLVLIDSRSVDLTSDPTQLLGLLSDQRSDDPRLGVRADRKLQQIFGDDIAPSFLASFLRFDSGAEVRVVRPPLALDGGDFICLSSDDVAVSESTLRYNGGRDDELRATIQDYFGVKRVHFLPTLPGRTIDHLDFIMQGTDEGVVVIAKAPPQVPQSRVYAARLDERVRRTLEKNRDYLRKHFPKLRIIELPMPPPIVASREQVQEDIRRRIYRRLAAKHQIDLNAYWRGEPGNPAGAAAATEFKRIVAEHFGAGTPADFDRVAREVLGDSVANLEATFVDEQTIYRTYVNATLIRAADGRTAIIIPRYQPRDESERPMIAAMEAEVLAAYRSAVPDARLIWLDCDELINELGAVHCVTHTVPAW